MKIRIFDKNKECCGLALDGQLLLKVDQLSVVGFHSGCQIAKEKESSLLLFLLDWFGPSQQQFWSYPLASLLFLRKTLKAR